MFQSMSFGEAVAYVQMVGSCTSLLLLLLPVAAIVSIRYRRKKYPGASVLFAKCVLIGWCAFFVWIVWIFVTGRWYGENGPPPQETAFQVTVWFLFVIALYVALILSVAGNPRNVPPTT
jgi:hypothetical protein